MNTRWAVLAGQRLLPSKGRQEKEGGANSKIPAPPLSKILASSMVGLIPKFRILPDFHTFSISLSKFARFSYFFQSHCQSLPDFHTFSIFLSKFARFSYFFSLFVKIGQIFILFQSSYEKLPDFHIFSVFKGGANFKITLVPIQFVMKLLECSTRFSYFFCFV